MAAEENQVDVHIKLTADNKGGTDAEKSLDKVEKKAKRSFKSIVGGLDDAKRAAGVFQKAIGSLANFGFVTAGFNSLIGVFDKFISSQNKAKEEAIKLAEAEKDAADAKRVEKLAEAYDKLKTKIADAAKARERANELEDMERSAADKLEDDTAELKMREEIAALDPNDPLYDKKKDVISASYETERLRRSVARQQRDANIAEKRTWDEREATIGESTEKQFSLIADREELARLKREAAAKRAESVSDNPFDVTSIGQAFAQNLKAILTLDGNRFWNDRTEKGDEYRAKAEEEAKAIEERVKAKEKEIAAKEKEISDLDKTAEHQAKKAAIQGNIAVNAGVAVESAAISANTTNAAAQKALSDEQSKIANARKAIALLQQQKAELEAKRDAAQSRKDAANLAVYDAKGNAETADRSGNRRDRAAAGEALRAAEVSAQNVNHEADKTINAVNTALNGIASKLKQFQHIVENFEKRTNASQAESVSGQ